jgi:hypothetical protein
MDNKFNSIRDVYKALIDGKRLVAKNGTVLYMDGTGEFNIPNPVLTDASYWSLEQRKVTVTKSDLLNALAKVAPEIKGTCTAQELVERLCVKLGL